LNGIKRDGYWWLAFDYMNFRLIGNVGNRKKGVWFPLANGSLLSTYAEQNEESESRYFIDPIDENDVSLIAFDEEGKITATHDANEWERERVKHTAKLLELNDHAVLAEERRKVWQRVNGLIAEYTIAKGRCTPNNPAAKEKLREVRGQLRDLVKHTAELSAVARCCLMLRHDLRLMKLIG
jgi:hypothetical protein